MMKTIKTVLLVLAVIVVCVSGLKASDAYAAADTGTTVDITITEQLNFTRNSASGDLISEGLNITNNSVDMVYSIESINSKASGEWKQVNHSTDFNIMNKDMKQFALSIGDSDLIEAVSIGAELEPGKLQKIDIIGKTGINSGSVDNEKFADVIITINVVSYTISYDLAGGVLSKENPGTYNGATETFILNNPTKEGYVFVGWTGSNGDTPQEKVTIEKGSVGNKSYIANWKVVRVIPEGATYTVASTGKVLSGGDEFPETSEIGDIYTEGDYKYAYQKTYKADGSDFATPLGDGFYENTEGWSARVIDSSKSSYRKVKSNINGSDVSHLTNTWRNCTSLTTAPMIPTTVTNMCGAFQSTSITAAPEIPDSVINMQQTFQECTSLTTAPTIGNSVENMSYAFYQCTALTTAPTIGNSVENMQSAFNGCTALTTASAIPDSVTNMSYAFYKCIALTTASAIPDSVITLESCFADTALTTAPTIGNSIENMKYTFAGCKKLTTASTIPNSVTNMFGTFQDCVLLKTVSAIPDSVTNMSCTFTRCTSLTTAPTIGNSVENMQSAFNGCTALTTASAIPDSVTNMDSTFYKCIALTTAPTIGNSVTNMTWAFAECTSLTTAPEIPNSVTNMAATFYKDTALTGTIVVNANPTDYGYCLAETRKPIKITGSCTTTTKKNLANSNDYWKNVTY